jgi:hypothetical protein
MTPDSPVQTPQESRSLPAPAPGNGSGQAVCLRSPRGGKLVVVRLDDDKHAALLAAGWAEDLAIPLGGSCRCGCGLPLPLRVVGTLGAVEDGPLQRYADPESCRRAIYALMHPTLDLSGMLPEKAKQAARMAEEAVKAAKLGQPRATVDARGEVEHKATNPDPRPSCRLRVTPRHFELLAAIKALGFHENESFSAIVMDLIEREAEDCRLRARQEGEHDV